MLDLLHCVVKSALDRRGEDRIELADAAEQTSNCFSANISAPSALSCSSAIAIVRLRAAFRRYSFRQEGLPQQRSATIFRGTRPRPSGCSDQRPGSGALTPSPPPC